MPYQPVQARFYDSTGNWISFYHNRVDEPPSGTTNGTTLTLTYTPSVAGQIIRGGQVSGPTGRGRVEVSVNGGGVWANVTSGITLPGLAGVPQTVLVRGVAVPFSGDNSEVSGFCLTVTDKTGQAGWLD